MEGSLHASIFQDPSLPSVPHLLQAQLGHITEAAETELGEVVLIALESDGREPGLRRVQGTEVQGHGVQKGLGRPKREEGIQAGQRPLFISVFFWACLFLPWLFPRPVPGPPGSLQSVRFADQLVQSCHQLVKVRPLGTVLLPSVQHQQMEPGRTAWRWRQSELLFDCIQDLGV